MRRFVAALGFLAFANVSLVQASGFCPLAGRVAHAAAASTTAHHLEHAVHEAVVASATGAFDEAPVPDQGHPSCLMTGPCGLNVDVGRVIAAGTLPSHTDGVSGGSDRAPPSQTTSPDIPPPRA